jgi:glycosyltransferase involved in cell wall biosynthesis
MKTVKISTILVCKNSVETISKSLQSLVDQTFKSCEIIVVDGNSTDGTKKFLQSFKKKIDHLIIEEDCGISEAFNKGLNKASGEWIYFLNSDDYLISNNILEKISLNLTTNCNFVIGKVNLINKHNKIEGEFGGKKINFNNMRYYNVIPHQSTFINKILFNKINMFDENLKLSMDYDFYWKNKSKLKIKLIDICVAYVTKGGISEKKFINLFKEYSIIQNKYNVNNLLLNKLNYFYRILKFFIKKLLFK